MENRKQQFVSGKLALTFWSIVSLLFLGTSLWAQTPVVKVDLNMSGRSDSEVNEPGYESWPVTTATTSSNTYDEVTITFTYAGANGTNVKSNWYKAGIQTPYYARLVSDGLTVENGTSGAQIEMTISGLPAGKHSLLVYHNNVDNSDASIFCPVDISVDGTLMVNDLMPTARALSNYEAETSYFYFTAKSGTDVAVLFKAETSSSATNKNVIINGFELNTPNSAKQATHPSPVDGDKHVNADSKSLTLSWTKANIAASHNVYFGTEKDAVESATIASGEFMGNQSATTFSVNGLYNLNTYYWRVDEVDAGGNVTQGNTWSFKPRQLAFPEAEGYGRYAIGGRGGVVVHVSNLNDSGAGSLREAIENDIGPRTIVFDVSGIITLQSRLTLSSNNVTVAGQTAPGKGICVRSAPFGLSGAQDAIIQNVRVRLGGGATYDGMGMNGCNYCIIDHSSISWTIDEAFSSRSGKNITLQRTLISEALNIAGHKNYPVGTAHGYAATISGDVGSFHHNLLAHCEGRNWSLGGGLDGDGNFAGRLDIFNNVVYNWGHRTTDGGAHEVNFVNNYYKPGPASGIFTVLNLTYDNFPGTQQFYVKGNVMPGYFNESNQSAGLTSRDTPTSYSPWVSSPFFESYAKIHSAGEAYKNVLSDVGCIQPVLDDHDIRVINETLNGTYTYSGSVSGYPGLPDKESDVGGYESYPVLTRSANWDSDGDGLPDIWEELIGTSVYSSANDFSDSNADADGNGYTNLEEYLQWISYAHYSTDISQNVSVDLSKLFVGYTSSPSFAASNVENGSVSVSGKTATFTPSSCGLASFDVTVTDAAGSKMTKIINVFVDKDSAGNCSYSSTEDSPYIEAEDYTSQSGIRTETCSEGGENVAFVENGDWIGFSDVDFGAGASRFIARVASTTSNATIHIRIDGYDNSATEIGVVSFSSTGGWQNWADVSCAIARTSGIHDVYLVFEGGSGYLFNVNYFYFTGLVIEAEDYTSQSGIYTETCGEGGENVAYIENGDWIGFSNIDFASGVNHIIARAATTSSGGKIHVRIDGYDASATEVGTIDLSTTGGWQTYDDFDATLIEISGVHDLYLVFEGGSGFLFNLNYVYFDSVVITELIKHGAGSSSQTVDVGTAITDFYFNWTNATTASASGLPAGVNAVVDNTAESITITGTPTESGVFTYTIVTSGGATTATRSGKITVNALVSTITIQEDEIGFCSVDGSVDLNNAGFSGDGFANTSNAIDMGITWSIVVPTNGSYSLLWKHANGGSTDRAGQLMVDGVVVVSSVSLPATGSWTTWVETSSQAITLSAGTHLIRLQAITSSGLSNVDYMSVTGVEPVAVSCGGLKVATYSDVEVVTEEVKLYPNPVSGTLINIEGYFENDEDVIITIGNNLGQIVAQKLVSDLCGGGFKTTVNVSDYSAGVYYVKIQGGREVKTISFIKN